MTNMNLICSVSVVLMIGFASNVSAATCPAYDLRINGCSFSAAEDLGIDVKRCNEHDRCYRIIGNSRIAGDKEFRKALRYDCLQDGAYIACLAVAEAAYKAIRNSNAGIRGYSRGQRRSLDYFSDTAARIRTGQCDIVRNAPVWSGTESTHIQAHLIGQMYNAVGLVAPLGETMSGLLDFLALSGADTNDEWIFTLASYLSKEKIGELETTVTHENFVNNVIAGVVELPNEITPSNNGTLTIEPTDSTDETLANRADAISRTFSSIFNTSM